MSGNERQRQLLLRIDSWGFALGGMVASTAGMLAGWAPSQTVLFIVAAVMLAASISARRSERRIEEKSE